MEQCRAGRGPVLLEAKTMRMKGHAQHDAAEYVPQGNARILEGARSAGAVRKISDANNLWDEQNKTEIDARIESELDAEEQFAEEARCLRLK